MQQSDPITHSKLVFQVHFLLGRYHGKEWPPSPRRFFLAMISALYQGNGNRVDIEDGRRALEFLENRQPPHIHAIREQRGSTYTIFVPDNDMDVISKHYAKGKEPKKKPSELKSGKNMRPYIVEGDIQYLWNLDIKNKDEQKNAEILCSLAKEIPVLGLGIDPVSVNGEITDKIKHLEGTIQHIPDDNSDDEQLQVPAKGLLENAEEKHSQFLKRIIKEGAKEYYVQPIPITKSKNQRYRKDASKNEIIGFRINHIPKEHNLVQKKTIPDNIAPSLLEEIIRQKDSNEGSEQIKVTLLPSIGGRHADMMIRRAAFIVPSNIYDKNMAYLGADGKIIEIDGESYQLNRLSKDPVLDTYKGQSRLFASVTPLKLGQDGLKREDMEKIIIDTLRKEGVNERVTFLNVRKEPFFKGGCRLDGKDSTYAEIEFESEVGGAFLLGNEQKKGYGLLAPKKIPDVAYFSVVGVRPDIKNTITIGNLIRQATMSKMKETESFIPPYISGHDKRGESLRQDHRHAFWLPFDADNDGFIDHVAVYVKGGFDHAVREVFHKITRVYDGKNIEFDIRFKGFYDRADIAEKCPLFGKHKTWHSVTPYFMPWHKKNNFGEYEQLKKECKRRFYSDVVIDSSTIQVGNRQIPASVFENKHRNQRPISKTGNILRLCFDKEVRGPIVLGFGCHFALGMFVPDTADI